MAKRIPPIDRLMARVIVTPGPLASPCWLCSYRRDRDGYAEFWAVTTTAKAHRFSYEFHVGPISDGLVIDHLCMVRHCVNPAHLEAVTNHENLRRSMSPTAITVRTDTCKRGHSMADAYMRPNGERRCRRCHLAEVKARYWTNH